MGKRTLITFNIFKEDDHIKFEIEHISKYIISSFAVELQVQDVRNLIEAYEKGDCFAVDCEFEYNPKFMINNSNLIFYYGDNSVKIMGDRKILRCINKLKNKLAEFEPASVNEY